MTALPLTTTALCSRCGALSKRGHRLLSSLDADPSSADRLIRKFVASSPKPVSLNILSHLLSNQLSSFSLPMYRRITESSWFEFNPKLVASTAALLHKDGRLSEAETLISESVSNLGFRELSLFYCDLIESYSKLGLEEQVFNSYAHLKQIPGSDSTGRRAYKSMINGLCMLDRPQDAEEMIKEMGIPGLRPSAFEFRSVVSAYGRSGLFSEMRRVLQLMEDSGHALDTVCSNIVLSCYGDHGKLAEMVLWLRKMRDLDVVFSIRTYNSVLNSSPTIMMMLRDLESLPLSIGGLYEKLKMESSDNEVDLVRELASSRVLVERLEWSSLEGKLDLHGMHMGSVYIILLQWIEEMRERLHAGMILPLEMSIVCGSGKHSSVRGESPIKMLVSEMMFRMRGPMKIDRKNVGRLVARGKAVKDWLS